MLNGDGAQDVRYATDPDGKRRADIALPTGDAT